MVNRAIEFVSFLDALGVALVITLIPFFTKELGVGAFGFGAITSLYGFCQIIGGSIIGYLSNGILSRKMILLISSIGSGVSYALLLIRGSITSLVVSRVLIGLLKQSTTSCKALAMMSKDDHSPQRFSLIAALRHMGSFTGSLLLSLITSHFPLEYAILLCVVLYVIESMVIIWFIDSDDDSFSVDSSTSEVNSNSNANANSNSNSNSKSSSSRYGLHLTPLLLLYFAYLFFIDVLNKGFGSIKIVLLQDQFDGSPSQIGFLYVLSNLYMFLTEFFITPFLSRHFSSLRLVRLSILLLLVGKLAQLLLSSFSQYLLLCVPLNTIGEEIFATTFVHLLASIAPPRSLNASLAYYDVVESLCRLVGPVLLGRLAAQLGATGCVLLLSGCWMVLGLAWSVMPVIGKEKEKKE